MKKVGLLIGAMTVLFLCGIAHAVEIVKPETKLGTVLSREGEFLIDTCIIHGSAFYHQDIPAVAFDGTNHFVVWQDWREIGNIYGARVDHLGHVIDSTGIKIVNLGCYPAVAFDGTNYLVVWSDEEEHFWSEADIYGTRVDEFGNVLDSTGFLISSAPIMQVHPAVAFDGTNYLVVWKDYRWGAPDIYGARVSQSGVVLDPNGIAISAAPDFKGHPSVAFDGANYLVVWQDSRGGSEDIYGARVNQSGVVLDPGGIAISTAVDAQVCPNVAFNGVDYLIVWQDQHNTWWDIYGARVDTHGSVLDSVGIPISTEVDSQKTPQLSFDGTNFLVVWEDYRGLNASDIYGARIDHLGKVLDSAGIMITNELSCQLTPVVSFGSTDYLVLWEDNRTDDIYGARVDTSGNVLDTMGILVSKSTNYQEGSSIAFDGTNYMVVWQDWRGGFLDGIDIYGARVGQSGNVLDSISFAISTNEQHQGHPVAAFAGSYHFVAWHDDRNGPSAPDIFGTRVDQSGNVIDTNGIPVSVRNGRQKCPVIASDGTNYLIVWGDNRSGSYGIYGTRVDQAGNVLDPAGIVISTQGSEYGQQHAIAFGNTSYFVVWKRNLVIYGARVDQSGYVLDPTGIPIYSYSGSQYNPAVAFDGTNYMVVWTNDPVSVPSSIYGARVNQDGVVLDPGGIVISNAPVTEREPVIGYNGEYYLVAWEDWRDGLDKIDIYGALVDTSGTVVDSFCINNASKQQVVNAMAHGVDDQLLITYTGWASIVDGKVYDAKRIWGKFYPFVGIEEDLGNEISDMRCNLMVYPNPFSKLTNISFGEVQRAQSLELRIYNTTGRLVKSFHHTPGAIRNRLSWDGRDDSDNKLPSGVYFITINVGVHTTTEKLLLIR